MHKIFIIAVLCFFSTLATLFGIEPENAQKQINDRLQAFIEAINQHKVEDLPTFWTDDARLINPANGEVYKGKQEIADYLKKRNQEIQARQLLFTFTPSKINFPSANHAEVVGIVEIKDKGELIKREVRKIELVNQNGQWFIQEVREIEAAPPPPVFDHLKELGWLIGNWKDSDQDVTITFSAKWDKYKNFIVQNFKIESYGQETMEGIQIIGWDPIRESFRSWIFDSDGGFGHGIWTKKNGDWQVALRYTLNDGSKGFATNIYSDINNESYKYQSIDRSIDGEPLDNIQPVTVKKEKE